MINNVYGGSEFLQVQTYANTPYISSGTLSAGQVRFNPTSRTMEVYDGSSWVMLASQAEVRLSSSAEEILRWGRQKMQEEAEYKKLAEASPAVQDALNNMQKAEAQLRVVTALVRDHEPNT